MLLREKIDMRKLRRYIHHKIRYRGYEKLIELREIFRKTGEARWVLGLDDAVRLDKIIKKYNVKKILELGMGIGQGTLGMAWSLPSEGHIDSVEQYDKCINIAKSTIPHEYLEKITIYKSDVEAVELFKYIYGLCYKDIPEGDYDLIVIDGPASFMENNYFVMGLRGDILRMIEDLKDGTLIYFDTSKSTVKLLKRFYTHYLIPLEENLYKVRATGEGPVDNEIKLLQGMGFFNNL
jgi:predicted O-methyltransferase YrrM